MDALGEDIEFLNSELLLQASDPEEGGRLMRLLGAHPAVIHRIETAGSKAIGMAVRCRVPLVMFSKKLDELLGSSSSIMLPGSAQSIPESFKALTSQTLQVAQRVALVDRTVAQLHFDFTPKVCDLLINASTRRLRQYASGNHVLLRLRAAEKVHVWDRLLIADRCSETLGARISQQAALQSLGND